MAEPIPQNSAPQIGDVAAVTFLENDVRAAPRLLMPDAVFDDVEDNLDGGTVVLSGLLAEDRVAIRNQGSDAGEIGVSGSSVSYGGVVIGSFAGGDGAALTVTLNDAATSAAVEALLRNLTYANDSHAPTATRTLGVQVTDASGADLGRGPAVITPVSMGATPYDVGPARDNFNPAFVDLNGDGVLDMLLGNRNGMVDAYIRNPNDTLTRLDGAANPFNGIDFGNFASLASNDFDGDGRLDMVVTSQGTSFRTFHNNGDGSFTELTGAANPLAGTHFWNNAEVTFLDVDSDGDNDLLFTSWNEGFRYYRNDGDAFRERTGADNPFAALGTQMQGNTALDVDGDGLLDVVVENGDPLVVLHNNGDGSFTMVAPAQNPFTGLATDGWLLESVDFDGDGDLDIIHGGIETGLGALRNDSSAGEPLVVTITRQNDAPQGVDRTVTLLEDASAVLGAAAFGFDDAEGDALAEARVVTLPAAGTLYLNAVAVITGQWISAADIAAGNLSFVPAADANGAGYASFTYQLRDNGGTGNDGIDLDPTANTITLDVTPVDDPHTLTGVPAALSMLENTANATPQLLMPAAVFSDVDNGLAGGTVTVKGLLAEDRVAIRNQGNGAGEIGVSGSDVSFGGVQIGSFTGGTGNAFTLTFNDAATSAAIEAALRNLTYDDASNTPTATRKLVVQITDAAGHDLGRAASSYSVGTNPFPPADPFYYANFTNQAYGDINGDGRVDVVAGRNDGGFDTYLRNTDGSFSQLVGAANPFGAIDFNSSSIAALADFDGDGRLDLLATSTNDYSTRIFHNDGNGAFSEVIGSPYANLVAQGAQYAFADFDHDGDLDVVMSSNGGFSYRYYDNGYLWSSGALDPLGIPEARGIAAVDFDHDGWMDLAITSTNNGTYAAHNNRDGTFSLLTGAANPLAGKMNGAYSIQSIDYDADGDLDLIYAQNSTHAFQALRNDAANGVGITVTVTRQNDAPQSADATLSLSEDGMRVLGSAAFAFSDPDGDSFAGIYVTTLPTSGTLYTVVGTTRTAVAQGEFVSASNISSERFVFVPAADANGTDQARFTFQVVDSGPVSSGDIDTDPTPNTIRFDITPGADAPVVHGVPASVNLLESTADGAHQLLLPNVTYAHADGVAGGSITVSGLLAEDRVSIRSQGEAAGEIGVSGSDIRYGGVLIGSFSGGNGTALSVTLNSAASAAAVHALLVNLSYANASDTPTESRDFHIEIVDAGGREGGVPTTFVEQTGAQNPFAGVPIGTTAAETPALADLNGDGRLDVVIGTTGGLRAYLADADGSYALAPGILPTVTGNLLAPAFHDYDSDGDSDLIVGVSSGGTRLFRNDGGAFAEVTGSDNPFGSVFLASTIQLAFGDADLDGQSDFLVVRGSGANSFLYRYAMQDGQYVTVSASTTPFLGVSLRLGDTIGFVDLDGDGRDDMVVSGGNTGVRAFLATNDGYVPTSNARWGLPNMNGGRIAFGDMDGNGTVDMVVAKAGEPLHLYRNTATTGFDVTVHVAGVDDAPTGADTAVTIAEDGSHVFQPSDFGFGDADGDSPYALVVTTLPENGTLEFDGLPVRVGDAIPWAGIADGWLVFTPEPNGNGEDHAGFEFQVRDDSAGAADTDPVPNSFTFDVTAANDAPVFAPAATPPVALTHGANAVTATAQSVSADGARIVFASSSQLVAGDTDSSSDIYLLDRSSGALMRLTDGAGAGYSTDPVISADGSTVAFFSTIGSLVAGDTNGVVDVFVYDVTTGTVTRASQGSDGSQGSGFTMYDTLAISADGTMVAFTSRLEGLVPGDTNSNGDVFLKNLLTGALERVSVASDGQELSQGGYMPFFSHDGTRLGFVTSGAATADDTNGGSDIYVRDLATGEVTRVTAGIEVSGASYRDAAFSPDGTRMLFSSSTDGLVEGDANDEADLFVLDLATGAVTLVSGSAAGEVGDASSHSGRFSPDGTHVVFTSFATNLIPGESVGGLFRKDLATGEITRLSVNADGNPSEDRWNPVAYLSDGQLLIASQAALLPGDADDLSNDFYVVTLHEPPVRYLDGGAPAVVVPDVVVSDVDGDNVGGGSLTVTIAGNGEESDQLLIVETATPGTGIAFVGEEMLFDGVIVGTYLIGRDTMSFSFNDSATTAMVEALAEAIRFESSSTTPTEGIRTVSFAFDDGDGASAGFVREIDVVEVNNAPVSNDRSVTFDEDSHYTFGISDFGFDDVDSEGDALTHILIDTPPAVGLLILDGTPVMPGQAIAVADIVAGKLVYLSIPDAHGSFDLGFRGVDNGGTDKGGRDTSQAYVLTLDITSVNDDPVVSLGAFGTGDVVLDMVEGDLVLLAPEAQFTDDSASLEGGSITLSIAGGTDDDQIFIAENDGVTVEGDALLVDGIEIGRFSGGGAEDLVVALGADATPAAIQMLMRSVGYTTLSNAPPASRTITVVVTDSEGGTSAPATATVTIETVDEAPVPTDDAATVAENATVVIDVLANDLDADGGAAGLVVQIDRDTIAVGESVTLASGAKVTLGADGTLTYDPNGVFNHLVPQSSGATNGSATDLFSYEIAGGSFSAGVTVTVTGVHSQNDRYQADSGDNTLTGTAGANLFMLADGGTDHVSGGGGEDGFYMGAALDADDRIDGGTNPNTFDQLGLQGDYSYTFSATNLVGIEILVLLSGGETAYGNAGGSLYTYDLTTIDANVAAGQILTINGNQLQAGEDVFFDGAAERDGSFRFNMSGGDDVLIGGAQTDYFSGLWGRDTMTGGGGNDIFYFRYVTESATSAMDSITDFTAGDKINLYALDANSAAGGDQAFTFIGADAFTVGTRGQLHVTGSGTNWIVEVEVDGDGIADMAIAVTTTASGYGWSAADFVL